MCADCKVAGEFNLRGQYDKAEEMHGYCKGDCACQHKTGPEAGSLAFVMAEPMRTQFPLE